MINTLSLSAFRNSIVHITGDTYYAVLGAFFCKRIITIHDLSFLQRSDGWKRKLLKLFWVSLPVKFSHRVTVVSDATKLALLNEVHVDPAKVHVVSNFIDSIYQPVKRVFNAGNPRILQVGTDFNKNIINLACALKGIDCVLVIIGRLSGAQKQNLEKNKIKYENRHSISREDLHLEYLKADMMCFASTIEGFGLPILEAQATGLPVITSNCSSMPQVSGGGALLVDPLDIDSIREGVMDMIGNTAKRNALVETGLQNVKKYTKENVAEGYLKLYLELNEETPV
jgi:glycosyltransferase involved in cell wall biosynthesis